MASQGTCIVRSQLASVEWQFRQFSGQSRDVHCPITTSKCGMVAPASGQSRDVHCPITTSKCGMVAPASGQSRDVHCPITTSKCGMVAPASGQSRDVHCPITTSKCGMVAPAMQCYVFMYVMGQTKWAGPSTSPWVRRDGSRAQLRPTGHTSRIRKSYSGRSRAHLAL